MGVKHVETGLREGKLSFFLSFLQCFQLDQAVLMKLETFLSSSCHFQPRRKQLGVREVDRAYVPLVTLSIYSQRAFFTCSECETGRLPIRKQQTMCVVCVCVCVCWIASAAPARLLNFATTDSFWFENLHLEAQRESTAEHLT